jgi:chitin disaccharide deacetylase
MKNITLCADDYGQNESVSQGILELIAMQRLSAVSCMTGYTHWPIYAAQLVSIKDDIKSRVDIGLHFDLTEFIASQGWNFNQFIIQCCLNRVDLGKVEAELNRQLDAFERELTMPPEFVDGHQHIHVFPNIRQVFLRVLTQRYAKKLPYIRLSEPVVLGHDSLIKAIILRTLSIGFARLAQQLQFTFPRQFLGMYSLKAVAYNSLFKAWLKQAKNGCLFMCHPGLSSTDLEDPIKQARLNEFNYFRSDEFLADLHTNNLQLSKWA